MRQDLSDVLIVFDLDGTLVDTAPDLIGALNHVLALHGVAQVAPASVRHLVGRGVAALLDHGYRSAGKSFDPADHGLVQQVISRYRDSIADESRAFPGAEAALHALAEAGASFGICTNKPTHLAIKLLDELALSRHFRAIVGSELGRARKPDPRHLAETIAACGHGGARIVMVGDSIDDIAAAHAYGVPSIAVRFGYLDRPADDLGADRVIDGFDELFDAVVDLLARHPPIAARAGG